MLSKHSCYDLPGTMVRKVSKGGGRLGSTSAERRRGGGDDRPLLICDDVGS